MLRQIESYRMKGRAFVFSRPWQLGKGGQPQKSWCYRLRSHPTNHPTAPPTKNPMTPPTKNPTLLAPRKLSLSLFCFYALLSCVSVFVSAFIDGFLTLACPPRSKEKVSFAFLSFLLVLLAPRNFCLSLACPPRSTAKFPCLYPFLSFSIAGRAALLRELLSVSLAPLLVCIHTSLSLLLGELLYVARVALCLSRFLACSTCSKETHSLSLACPSCSILISLSCLSSSLQVPT
jgi:hypothetical protein